MSIAIKVENLSKRYQIGKYVSGSLRETLVNKWSVFTGKEKVETEEFWALKNVSFEVKQGEVLGIIGKNGAGKSTLLKILSRITEPTAGRAEIFGRVSSLLEVGTGFHPELTGRENILLNGTILGMSRKEVKSKFDEIVDFSGIEKFIDTPVKHYSSGMYVRLAFAVAAHLEPEILMIDEVLAVGDAEFQKKCLGKMKDVAGQGRTVLFVSHNMTAVNTLCSKVLFIKNGVINRIGSTPEVIKYYMSCGYIKRYKNEWSEQNSPGDDYVKLLSARIINEKFESISFSDIRNKVGINFTYKIIKAKAKKVPIPNISLHTDSGILLFWTSPIQSEKLAEPEIHDVCVWFPPNFLNTGTYLIGIAVTSVPYFVHFYEPNVLSIDMIEDENRRNNDYKESIPGAIRPQFVWNI